MQPCDKCGKQAIINKQDIIITWTWDEEEESWCSIQEANTDGPYNINEFYCEDCVE